MTTGHRLLCKELLCFNIMPCRHMPLLVHFWTRGNYLWLPRGRPRAKTLRWQPSAFMHGFYYHFNNLHFRKSHTHIIHEFQLHMFASSELLKCRLLKRLLDHPTSHEHRRLPPIGALPSGSLKMPGLPKAGLPPNRHASSMSNTLNSAHVKSKRIVWT